MSIPRDRPGADRRRREGPQRASSRSTTCRGGTFTISNLGAIGGTYSTPIINLPEVAILLVGRSRKLPVVVERQDRNPADDAAEPVVRPPPGRRRHRRPLPQRSDQLPESARAGCCWLRSGTGKAAARISAENPPSWRLALGVIIFRVSQTGFAGGLPPWARSTANSTSVCASSFGAAPLFVSTAPLATEGHINLSPKGLDTLRVLDPRQIAYLDLTGSGVETIAHLRQNGRLTIMLCAFEGPPRILRLYGSGTGRRAGRYRSGVATGASFRSILACDR